MKQRRGRSVRTLLTAGVAALGSVMSLGGPAMANPAQGVPSTASLWRLRTPAEMQAFEAAHQPVLAPDVAPFRPTMDIADYLAAKAAAGAAPQVPKHIHRTTAPAAPPLAGAVRCGGIDQVAAGGGFPPDTHGAVGLNHFVEIVNFAIRIYSKGLSGTCPTLVSTLSLSTFFGYTAATLFDPRAVYDMTFDRWIITAEGFPEGGPGSNQFHFVAVSQTGNPTGSYFIYPFEMRSLLGLLGSSNDSFWDFPQLGYDEEAIVVTGNVFDPGYTRSAVFFLPKARMYSGLNLSFCIFDFGAEGTVAPPLVLDQSPVTALATSRVGANRIRLTKYTGTARVCPRFVEQVDLTPSQTLSTPPFAPQAGTLEVLDTSDGRFVNASTQFGMPAFGQTIRLWQTATIGTSFAIPRFYQINADEAASAIESECSYFASATSFDFNASIAANLAGTLFITYSSTDPSNNINPQVRFTGKKLGDACSALGAPGGTASKTSPGPLTGNFDPDFGAQRWGDYSAVTIDPAAPSQAWGINEFAKPAKWKNWLFNMSNP